MFSLTGLDAIPRTHPKKEEGGRYSILRQHRDNPSLFLLCSNVNPDTYAPISVWTRLCWGDAINCWSLSFSTHCFFVPKPNLTATTEVSLPSEQLTHHNPAQALTCVSAYGFRGAMNMNLHGKMREHTKRNPNNNEHLE